MIKNPYINAFLAAVYIVVIVLAIQSLQGIAKSHQSVLVPMVMLSLFVISAALMGVLFVYTPAKMFLDNQREAALTFFFKTVGTFACFAVIFTLLFLFL